MPLTNKPQPARLGRLTTGASLPLIHGVEKTGMSWKLGAFLVDDAAGLMIEATSPINGTNTTLGIATNAAKAVAGADVAFDLVNADSVYEANLSDATAGTHTLVQADQFAAYVLTKDAATGNWYLDGATETGGFAVVIAFKDPIGTVDARVYFIIAAAARGTKTPVLI